MSKQLVCAVLLVGIIAMACGDSDGASIATGDVSVEIKRKSHQDLTLKVGTTVTWTNKSTARHTTSADAGEWSSGELRGGESYSFTFTDPGTYGYHCNFHGMPATVTVIP